MEKIDLKKEFKHLNKPSAKEVAEVEVPMFNYLMVDGEGDPNTSQEYAQAVEARFSVSYTAKFMVKKGVQALDYAVMPLEGLCGQMTWRLFDSQLQNTLEMDNDDSATIFCRKRSYWECHCRSSEKEKSFGNLQATLKSFTEGRCAQILHIGPFSEEGPTIERVHNF